MSEHKVRRLPVIDGHDLIGIVSQADLARTSTKRRSATSSKRSRPPVTRCTRGALRRGCAPTNDALSSRDRLTQDRSRIAVGEVDADSPSAVAPAASCW